MYKYIRICYSGFSSSRYLHVRYIGYSVMQMGALFVGIRGPRAQKKPLQSEHLIFLPELHQILGDGSFNTTKHRKEIPHEHQASSQMGSGLHHIYAPGKLPKGVTTEQVVFPACLHHSFIGVCMLTASDFTMVLAFQFEKCSGLPPLFPRAEECDEIDAARSNGRIPSNPVKALPPEHLTRSEDILNTCKPARIDHSFLLVGSATDSQTRVLSKLIHQGLKIVRGTKGDVGVEIADHIKAQFLNLGISSVERSNFAGKMSFLVLSDSYKFNPLVLGGILSY